MPSPDRKADKPRSIFKTIAAAARATGIAESNLRRWASSGLLRMRRDGTYSRADIEAARKASLQGGKRKAEDPEAGETEQWRARRLRAMALQAELNLERDRGRLVALESAREAILAVAALVVGNLQNLALRLNAYTPPSAVDVNREIAETARRIQDGAAGIEIATADSQDAAPDAEAEEEEAE